MGVYSGLSAKIPVGRDRASKGFSRPAIRARACRIPAVRDGGRRLPAAGDDASAQADADGEGRHPTRCSARCASTAWFASQPSGNFTSVPNWTGSVDG